MILMTITLTVGAVLSAFVVLEALRPVQADHPFAAPRRRQPNRVLDTIRLENSMSIRA